MQDKKLEYLLQRETQEEIEKALNQDPSLKKQWNDFIQKEKSKAKEFARTMGVYTDEELEKYCQGTASEDLVASIDSDPDCLEWMAMPQDPITEEDEIRIQRVLNKVKGENPDILVFTWDENGQEVIEDGYGNVLLRMPEKKIPAQENTLCASNKSQTTTSAKADENSQKSIWKEAHLAPTVAFVVYAIAENNYRLSIQPKTEQYIKEKISLTGKTSQGKEYKKELTILKTGCIFTNLEKGEYNLSLIEKGNILFTRPIVLPGKKI